MMKNYFLQMRYQWFFILALIYTLYQLCFHYNHGFLVVFILIVLRTVRLNNLYCFNTALILTILAICTFYLQQSRMQWIDQLPIEGQEFVIQLASDPLDITIKDGMLSGQGEVSLQTDQKEIKFKVNYVQWLDEEEGVNSNHWVEKPIWLVKGEFKKPEESRNFNVFDYRDYLKTKEIMWQIEIKEIMLTQPSNQLGHYMKDIRFHLLQPFIQWEHNEWGALHNKLFLNLDSDHYKQVKDNFLSLGVAHYFAISGFHIYFIRKLLRYCLLRIGLTIEFTDKCVSILLLLYLWIVKWPVGVIRVLFMKHLADIFNYFKLPMNTMDRLAISAVLLLLMNPNYVLSLGFTLSYSLTLVVIIYNQEASFKPDWQKSFELTLTCLLFSWPIIIQTSFEWNLGQLLFVLVFSIVFNHVIMPLMFMTTLGMLTKPIGFEWILQGLNQFVRYFDQWNESNYFAHMFKLTIGHLDDLTFISLIATAIVFMIYIQRDLYKAYLIILSVYISLVIVLPYLNLTCSITIIDVDQGDAILYSLPFNQGHWLIDTGGRANWGEGSESVIDHQFAEDNLIPALKAMGINKLDGVILTHPDIDHIGNLVSLNNEVALESLWISRYTYESSIWQEMKDQIRTPSLNVLENGKVYWAKDETIKVFSMFTESFAYSQNESNDRSLIVQLQLGDVSVLSLGDISKSIDVLMIEDYPHISADIIKIAHHGSDTSTSDQLLKHIKPKLAVNSAGLNNRYGHPHQSVIDSLHENKVPLLSTHERGAIQITYHPIWGYGIETVIQ